MADGGISPITREDKIKEVIKTLADLVASRPDIGWLEMFEGVGRFVAVSVRHIVQETEKAEAAMQAVVDDIRFS